VNRWLSLRFDKPPASDVWRPSRSDSSRARNVDVIEGYNPQSDPGTGVRNLWPHAAGLQLAFKRVQ
jgi:hypothetical protein